MISGFINKFFPPPKYLAMPAVGFDISDLSLKYAALSGEKKGNQLRLFGRKPIPPGVIESGEIKRKDVLIDLLKSVKEEIGEKYVIASLPEEKGFLSRLNLPEIEEKSIRGAVELQLEEKIPLPPEEVIFDFEIIEESFENKGAHIDVNLVAFPKKIVEDYRDIFNESGFIPLAFEMETQAFKRSVVFEGDLSAQMIVDFGKTRTTFIIVSNGKIQFTSTISVAGQELNKALARDLSIDISETEKIKKEKGLIKNKENEKVFNSLLPVISAIADEISKHIIYWDGHLDEHGKRKEKILKIILCGGDSNLFGLSEYLSYKLKIPAETANPWVNITSFEERVPQIELRESLMYATSLGLALRSVACE